MDVKMANASTECRDIATVELQKLLLLANRMTIVSSQKRQLLFQLAKAPLGVLLQLNDEYFEGSSGIRESLAGLAKALLNLRNLGDGNIETLDHDDYIDCPHCQSNLTHLPDMNETESDKDSGRGETDAEASRYIFCAVCSEAYTLAFARLSVSGTGFGLEEPLE